MGAADDKGDGLQLLGGSCRQGQLAGEVARALDERLLQVADRHDACHLDAQGTGWVEKLPHITALRGWMSVVVISSSADQLDDADQGDTDECKPVDHVCLLSQDCTLSAKCAISWGKVSGLGLAAIAESSCVWAI